MTMNVWIAGRDKPHRCPDCWSSQMSRKPWRLRRWLPRRCAACGAVTLTTWPRKLWGTLVIGRDTQIVGYEEADEDCRMTLDEYGGDGVAVPCGDDEGAAYWPIRCYPDEAAFDAS